MADRGRCAGDEVASVLGRNADAGLGLEGQDRHGHILADLNFCGPSKKKKVDGDLIDKKEKLRLVSVQ